VVAIFIDESGTFTAQNQFSVVAALSVPHGSLGRARRELARTTADWPRVDGELKGGQLDTGHLVKLVDVLFRSHAILHYTVAHVGETDAAHIQAHKDSQCEKLTKFITPEHHETVKRQLWELRKKLEGISLQLYVQCVAQTELLCSILEDIPNYWCQRRPKELRLFEWTIDAKDKNPTPQETWWRDTLGPLMESRSRELPSGRMNQRGFDYSDFDRTYKFEKEVWHPERPRERVIGIDIGKLITKRLSFLDSKADILIQAIDILAGFMRRVLVGAVTDADAINALGRMQIIRRRGGAVQAAQFIALSPHTISSQHLVGVLRQMTRAGRPLILPARWATMK
jgi:hypothetical protein